MKRLLSGIFILLAATSPALAVISEVTATAAAATQVNLGSHQWGDTEVACVTRDGSTTSPTLPSGYLKLAGAGAGTGANGVYLLVAYRILIGTESVSGTFTNATQVADTIYRGVDIRGTGPLNSTVGHNAASSTTVGYSAFTLADTSGVSWVIGCAGAHSPTGGNNVDQAPTGMTLRSGTGITNIAMSDTNGGVASWTLKNVTITNSVEHEVYTMELFQATGTISGISNQFVHHVYSGITGENCDSQPGCTFNMPVPASLAGNFLNVALYWDYASVEPTISNIYCNADTGHSTWTWTEFGDEQRDAGDLADLDDYYIDNATVGCSTVTVVLSSVTSSMDLDYSEWRGIATSNAVDATTGTINGFANPWFTAGNVQATQANDLVYEHCTAANDNIGINSTKIFGAPNATLLNSDLEASLGSLAYLQTLAGGTTPYMYLEDSTAPGNATGLCVALALKTSGGAGTALPSGLQIANQQSFAVGTTATTYYQGNIVNSGDALVIALFTGGTPACTGITDTLGNSYTVLGKGTTDYVTFGVACNTASGNDWVKMTGCSTGGTMNLAWIEIPGAAATGCFDATAGYQENSDVASPYTHLPDIGPFAGANELNIAYENQGTGPINTCSSPTGSIYRNMWFTGITDASFSIQGGGFGTYLTPNTSSVSWTWTSPNSSNAGGAAIALVPASTAKTYGRMLIDQ